MPRKKKPSEPLDPWAGSCQKLIKLRHLEDGKVYELHFDLKSSTIKAKPFQWKGKQRVYSDIPDLMKEFALNSYISKNRAFERQQKNDTTQD